MTKCLLIGYASGVSKKSGKPYYVVHIGLPIDNNYGTGFSASTFFVDETIYKRVIGHKPVEYVNADVRFVNGAKFLVDIE